MSPSTVIDAMIHVFSSIDIGAAENH